MYSQAQTYGPPSYSSQPYPPPPVNSFYGQPQQQYHHPYASHPPPHGSLYPPTPAYPLDPNTFRHNFMLALEELTVNSRPVIHHLSSLAQEFSRYADIVVSCAETHIRRVANPLKLLTWYLIDALAKNQYNTYARRFSPIITRLFLDTYQQADKAIRNRMEEMLVTWRSGSPSGTELFGSVAQLAIENGIWGAGDQAAALKAQVVNELQMALDAKKRQYEANPQDQDAQRKIGIMYQLRNLIHESGISQEEMRQVLEQLRELDKPPPPPPVRHQQALPPSNAAPTAYSQPPAYPPARQLPPQSQVAPFPLNPPPFPPPNGFPNFPPPVQQPPAPAPPAPTIDTAQLSNIINSLVNAGVVTAAGAPAPMQAPAVVPRKPQKVAKSEMRNSAPDGPWNNYRKAILSQTAKLSSTDILRNKPDIKSFLYDKLLSQCKQCGLRFSNSKPGRAQLQEHLDMHFKNNRQAAKAAGRGNSRQSFPVVDDWINNVEGSGDDKGKGVDNGTIHPKAFGIPVQSEAELRSQFVVVPPGDEAKRISCPVCKEVLKTEFVEDDEEWVWRNAVSVDGKIYHATCHAEAMAPNGLALRLRNDVVNSSRGGTPESRSTPPRGLNKSPSPQTPDTVAGTKRKVEHLDDPELTDNALGTPPMKKMVI